MVLMMQCEVVQLRAQLAGSPMGLQAGTAHGSFDHGISDARSP